MANLLRHAVWRGWMTVPRGSFIAVGLAGSALALAGTVTLDSDQHPARSTSQTAISAAKQGHIYTAQKSVTQFTQARDNLDWRLHEHQVTASPGGSSGISRYDVAQLACASPSEDDHAEAVLPVPTGSWSFFALLDGHNGWETSAWLRENVILAAAGALADLYQVFTRSNPAEKLRPSPNNIERTLKQTFMRLDNEIIHESLERVFQSSNPRTDGMNLLAPAYAGSCALLAFYDSHSRLLHVALTGDSRAILGRREVSDAGEVRYRAHICSVDQHGNNPAEAARLSAEHPGEVVIKNGRVLGMGVSRAFGDARYKWNRETQTKLKNAHMGRTPLKDVKTPPYLTAEPEVTSIEVQPGDFLILATDGLWEALSNEDAVGLVGWWNDSTAVVGSTTNPTQLPVDHEPVDLDDAGFNTGSERQRQWGTKKSFTKRDENVATHLIRNAIGGADHDLVTSILSMRPPRARTYIDDITVTVVFFDNLK